MSRINPNSAFTRIYFDLPTETAIKVEAHIAAQVPKISRKDFFAQLAINAVEGTANNTARKGKRSAK